MTSIEDLSSELFCEIFDYLSGGEFILAFVNLNYRLQQLLHSSSVLFKFRIRESENRKLMNKYKEIIHDYKHRIISFRLSLSLHNNCVFSSFSIDSSFDRLESLSLTRIDLNILPSRLIQLIGLSRLYSLVIDAWYKSDDLQPIYQAIFALPALKFYKFIICESNDRVGPISLPMATSNQFSTIEHLDMFHSCSIDELEHIVSYTPKLRHLRFISDEDFNSYSRVIRLPNLTYFSISANHLNFDDLETLIKNMHCLLKVLHFTIDSEYKDISYLDAARWEQLICQHLKQLKQFEFQYDQYPIHEHEVKKSDGTYNRFTSEFWLRRRWIYRFCIDDHAFIHSIRPYKYVETPSIRKSIDLF